MIEIKNYDDMSHMTSEDILALMATKSSDEIQEFKKYCSTPTLVSYKNGEEKERVPVFFEIRRWVVDRYFPEALKVTTNGGKKTETFYDKIMKL